MNKSIIFILIALSPLAYPCVHTVPAEQPVLTQFKSILLMDEVPDNTDTGDVEALLSIDKTGRVTKAELISVKPDSLDKEKILKEIRGARFSVTRDLNDYTHIFEFQILQR